MTFPSRRRWLQGALAGGAAGVLPRAWSQPTGPVSGPQFPRLAGYNIGAKHYDDPAYQAALARLGLVILGFYPGWAGADGRQTIRGAVRALKARNPALRVGQYTVLTEAQGDAGNDATADISRKLDQEGWWARNAAGQRVQWTRAYGAWEVNVTRQARQDAAGQRYPPWLAARHWAQLFRDVPEFDIWYVDNVYRAPRVVADWNGDGADDARDDPATGRAWREGYADYWAAIRRLAPRLAIIGNADHDLADSELRGGMEGALLEGIMGPSWSVEAKAGWAGVLARYRAAVRNTRAPHDVVFTVLGAPDDYRRLRYGYTTCLLDDGYFCYAHKSADYSSVLWFDEFDQSLGRAIDRPPASAWTGAVWGRRFERGLALVNTGEAPQAVWLEPGWRRLRGAQASEVNTGQPADTVTLAGRDGLLLVR